MNEARVVCKVHTLCELNGHIVDHFDVGARHINCQVEIQTLDLIEDVASIIVFDH